MEIPQEQREQIYLEEKSRRQRHGSSGLEIMLVASAAVLCFAGFLALVSGKGGHTVKIEDLRKAYDGLSPEEEQ